ncbi:uncharacterized protein, partial [Halyomorpha halys]|uniref:uncharacterized protein n=1 Tax=Halyomorpha halys TaxID=286706 RepID=UPI0006D512C6
MLGSLVTRISGFSPGGSPRPTRRRRPRAFKDEYREIQSEPEDTPKKRPEDCADRKPKTKRRIEKMRARRLEVSAPLQGSKSMGRLDGLKQIQRLSQYEEYFDDLVKEAHRERLREDEDIEAALIRAKQAVKRAKEESDLERIQDLFPNDSLKLYEKDVLTMRMKGLMRKRPSPA